MTTVGDVLDEFFSPMSSEKLWVMPQDDRYTEIVRKWQVVIDATTRVKSNLATNCAHWSANFVSQPTWKPTKTDTPKAHAHREFVRSPPGTDPDTCQNAFVIYVTSKAAKLFPVPNPLMPDVQTRDLYTCSIGSFNIYTTVDRIDCAGKTATMSFWMYNAMSRRSFGRFATHPAFRLSGMATQYMWWNWVESVDWTGGTVRTLPKPPGSKSRWS